MREYDAEDVADIVSRATAIAEARGRKPILEDIEAAAAESGLDPAAVRDAARVELLRGTTDFFGPRVLRYDFSLEGELPVEAHAELAQLLESCKGRARSASLGRVFTSTVERGESSPGLKVTVSPGDGRTTIVIEDVPVGARTAKFFGLVFPLLALTGLVPIALLTWWQPFLIGAAALAGGAATFFGLMNRLSRRLLRRREGRLRDLAAAINIAVSANLATTPRDLAAARSAQGLKDALPEGGVRASSVPVGVPMLIDE